MSMLNDASIVTEVSCPMCLELYENPRQMPLCHHTFCLKCMMRLPVEQSQFLRCPNCRTLNPIGVNGPTNFPRDYIAQSLVEKLKKHNISEMNSAGEEDPNNCTHRLQSTTQLICQHCRKGFCSACKIRHMEFMKQETIRLYGNITGKEHLATDVIEKACQVFAADQRKIIGKLAAFRAAATRQFEANLWEHTKTVIGASKQFVHAESERIQAMIAFGLETSQIERRHQQLASRSVLEQNLDEVAELYLDIVEQEKTVKSLEDICVQSPTSWLSLNANSSGFVESLQLPQFCRLELSPSGTATGCQLLPSTASISPVVKSFVEMGVQSPDVESIESLTSPMSAPFELASPRASLLEKVPVAVSYPLRIKAIPTTGHFAVLLKGCKISFYQTDGELTKTIYLITPGQSQERKSVAGSTEADDFAIDHQDRLFVTVTTCRDSEGKSRRHIYWVQLSVFSDIFKMQPFAQTDSDEDFQGLAIDNSRQLLVTTKRDHVVAYSIDPGKTAEIKFGKVAGDWSLGPNPFVHAVVERQSDLNLLNMVCSSKGCLRFWQINGKSFEIQQESRWTSSSSGDNPYVTSVPVANPAETCYWDEKFIIANGSTIRKFDLIGNEPIFSDTFPIEGNCINIAALKKLEPPPIYRTLGHWVAVLHRESPHWITFAKISP